jgi:hypothetical protein
VIVTFTDFGLEGPYLGQVRLRIARDAPGLSVVDLVADAPAFNPRASAYLLAALVQDLPAGAVCLAVVDPEVGMSTRRPAIVRASERWFVGPDNGLFHMVALRADDRDRWEIRWRPEGLSDSFHGRDLFAPVAAGIARGQWPTVQRIGWDALDFQGWSEDLAEVVYVDGYGNCMTGLRAGTLPPGTVLGVGGRPLTRRRTFATAPPGQGFWYENSIGLAEIAVNRGSAARAYGLEVGSPVVPEVR